LESALDDDCFISFFNAFLALPVFPQRLRFSASLYGFVDESLFEEAAIERIRTAPPLVLHSAETFSSQPLFVWVKSNRFPLLHGTDFHLQYVLCHKLCEQNPTLQNLDVHPSRICNLVRSYHGIESFEAYLQRSAGFACFSFWIDAARCLLTEPQLFPRRMRDVADRYFRPGMPLSLSSDFMNAIAPDKDKSITLTPSCLKFAQSIALEKLQSYWLPRFLLHRASLDDYTHTTTPVHHIPRRPGRIRVPSASMLSLAPPSSSRPFSAVGMSSPLGCSEPLKYFEMCIIEHFRLRFLFL